MHYVDHNPGLIAAHKHLRMFGTAQDGDNEDEDDDDGSDIDSFSGNMFDAKVRGQSGVLILDPKLMKVLVSLSLPYRLNNCPSNQNRFFKSLCTDRNISAKLYNTHMSIL